MNMNGRVSALHLVALLGAALLGGLIYSPSASAECWICAGRPGLDQICNKVYGGAQGCVSSNGNCATLGGVCMVTLAENGTPAGTTCASPSERKNVLDRIAAATPATMLVSDRNKRTNSSALIARQPSSEEMRQLEKMKLEVGRDMPTVATDYIELFKAERRDEVWASRTESYLSDELANMPLSMAGISKPALRCASSVCEIAVVQDATASQETAINWQMQIFNLTTAKDKPVEIADFANFATSLSKQKNGYVTYLLFER